MAKKQLNARISKSTRIKLDWLTERHGTQTEVIAVALDRLYRAERKMQMHIQIRFSNDSLWGPSDPVAEGYDERASAARYADLVRDAVETDYPDAEVEVIQGVHNDVAVDGYSDHDEVPFIEAVLASVYESFVWLVKS